MSVSEISQRQDIQNLKDAYDESEKSLEAKHRKQVAYQEQKHAETIKNLRDEYDNEIKREQETNKETISKKERGHIQEIQNLQAASRKKISSMRSDDDDRLDITKKTLEGDLQRTKEQSAKNQARLVSTFDNEMAERDANDTDTESRYREGSKEALDAQHKRMNEARDKERDTLIKAYDERIENRDDELTRLRKEKDRNDGDLKYQKDSQGKYLETKYIGMVDKERETYKESLDSMSEGFQMAIKENKRRFKEAAENIRNNYEGNFDKLKKNVDEKVNNDVLRQKQANDNLQSKTSFDHIKMKQDYEGQKANVIAEYKKNFDELERRRVAAVVDGNKMKKHEAESLQFTNEKAMQKINDDHLTRFEEYRNNVERSYIGQVDEANKARKIGEIRNDNVKKRMAENYADSLLGQSEFHEKQTQTSQREHEKMLGDQRQVMERQKTSEVKTLRDLNSKQNLEAQEKLIGTIDKYEGQINQLKQDFDKKLKRQGELFRESTERQNKYLQMDRENNDAKTSAKINQLTEKYEHQIETLKRKEASDAQARSFAENEAQKSKKS